MIVLTRGQLFKRRIISEGGDYMTKMIRYIERDFGANLFVRVGNTDMTVKPYKDSAKMLMVLKSFSSSIGSQREATVKRLLLEQLPAEDNVLYLIEKEEAVKLSKSGRDMSDVYWFKFNNYPVIAYNFVSGEKL